MTVDEFLLELRTPLDRMKFQDKDDFVKNPTGYHHSLGQWIRNEWNLWKGGNPLTDFFHEHGIWHADDMSAIILESYSRLEKGKPVEFEKQVKYYLDYWKKQKVDSAAELKKIIEHEANDKHD